MTSTIRRSTRFALTVGLADRCRNTLRGVTNNDAKHLLEARALSRIILRTSRRLFYGDCKWWIDRERKRIGMDMIMTWRAQSICPSRRKCIWSQYLFQGPTRARLLHSSYCDARKLFMLLDKLVTKGTTVHLRGRTAIDLPSSVQ